MGLILKHKHTNDLFDFFGIIWGEGTHHYSIYHTTLSPCYKDFFESEEDICKTIIMPNKNDVHKTIEKKTLEGQHDEKNTLAA